VRYWSRVGILFLISAGLTVAVEPEDVVILEWDVPTPNSRPHDPAFAPDGALWYTGQVANRLGRLDPRSGEIREYALKIPNSGPHGLVADREGNIWYTGNAAAHIGKLNTATGEIAEYAMPNPQARDPHTPIFDRKGILWFTVQNGNFLGRLDPTTGEVTLKQSPTPNSRPYGIAINSEGMLFYCENGTNRIGRINPDIFDITEYVLPAAARPRRIAVSPDDLVYYASDSGYLGRLDPKTGAVEEWLSPSGRQAAPYAIAATSDGFIWYCETGVQPNRLVRFDPKTKAFESWPVPSGGGVVRHMVATPERNLYLACSGVNKVGIAYLSNQRGYIIADRGGASWTSPGGYGSVLTGYARIQPAAASTTPAGFSVFSLRQNDILVSEASVPASPVLRGGRIYAEVNGPVKTGLAIANPNREPAQLSFYFTDMNGRDFGGGTTVIPAGEQIAGFLDTVPFNGGNSVSGTFTFSSSVPLSAIALRALQTERSELLMTTLPLADLSAPAADMLVFPHFAAGAGWATEVVLVNLKDAAAAGVVQFFALMGEPEESLDYALPPRSSRRLVFSGSGGTTRGGSVRVIPSGDTATPSGLLILSFKPGGFTVSEAGVPAVPAASAFRLYVEESSSLHAGIAVANLSSGSATVNFELMTLAGVATGLAGSATIPGLGQIAMLLSQIPGFANLPSPFQGVLRISTSSQAGISVTGLRGRTNERGEFLISATPAVSESSPASSVEMLFPHLADGAGYATQFVLFSGAAAQSSSGMLRFFGHTGRPLGLWTR
jgi:virginiamycin B lyase